MDPDDLACSTVGRVAYAATGERLGRVAWLYRDAELSLVFAAVETTRRGRRQFLFVPLNGAAVDDTSVTVRCGAELARRAPRTRRHRELPAELEVDLYHNYDLPYRPRDDGAARLHRDTAAQPRS